MADQKAKPLGTENSLITPVPASQKLVISDEEIQGTFEMLGLGDEARRAEFTNLRALASGFHVEQRTWTSADSVTTSDPKREA